MGYESPFTAAKINSIPEELTTGAGGMTIPLHMQRNSIGPMSAMLHHHQPRSKFMITDILGGGGKLQSENEDDERTPSPQPRDLSASSLRHHHDVDSDEDQSDSSMLDDHSVCSGNYQFPTLFYYASAAHASCCFFFCELTATISTIIRFNSI